MIEREATVLLGAYLLAGLPIVAALAAGKASPLYRLPLPQLAAWWSRLIPPPAYLPCIPLDAMHRLHRRLHSSSSQEAS